MLHRDIVFASDIHKLDVMFAAIAGIQSKEQLLHRKADAVVTKVSKRGQKVAVCGRM